jgi:probable aminopeptidase NPEPL1
MNADKQGFCSTEQGGAAAVLGAFESIVKTVEATGFSSRLYAVICLAENAIGPEAYRPDDMCV